MFEDRTYENILQEMLDDVPSLVDKRQGSIIYDAMAPAAAKLAQAYMDLSIYVNLAFGTTTSGEYLDRRAADYGETRRQATKAEHIGLFYDALNQPFNVPIGSRFAASGISFEVTTKFEDGEFKLVCETAGSAGNLPTGSLLPLDYVDGLAVAKLSEVLVPGEDQESDDAFRERYLIKARTPATSGNKAAYRRWAGEVAGVGDAKVVAQWNGPLTVKVFLLGTDKQPAGAAVVANAQAYIDPTPGMGEGAAPAGAVVTVVPADAVTVNVSATVTRNGTRMPAQIQTEFTSVLTEYLKDLAFSADPAVKITRVGALLTLVSGVQDYENLQLNGGVVNIAVGNGSVAVLGAVTLT